jgi:alkylation response protein AidB-like acyl-CoA dehydrogenase
MAMTDIIKLAETLADEFRPRAAEYDRTGEFPAENYRSMKESGYIRATVPEELGGLGGDLATMAKAQQALARGCASTALAVNMHLFQIGTTADAYRNGQPVEGLLRRVADEGIVLGSNGAEAIVAGEWMTAATAERRNGGYVVNGRKFFCSQAPGANIFRFLAKDMETGELLIMGAPAGTPGLSYAETWDTMGMRATASHDLLIENVELPETAVGARLPAGEPMRTPAFANVARWFTPLMASVYIGIAEEARAEAYKAIGTGINSANRHEVLTDVMIGEMETAFLAARMVRDCTVQEVNEFPKDGQAALTKVLLMKEAVIPNCIATVDKAVEIAGGRAYFKKSPLERLARDMRAAKFHPPSAPISFQIAGQRSREAMSANKDAVVVA